MLNDKTANEQHHPGEYKVLFNQGENVNNCQLAAFLQESLAGCHSSPFASYNNELQGPILLSLNNRLPKILPYSYSGGSHDGNTVAQGYKTAAAGEQYRLRLVFQLLCVFYEYEFDDTARYRTHHLDKKNISPKKQPPPSICLFYSNNPPSLMPFFAIRKGL